MEWKPRYVNVFDDDTIDYKVLEADNESSARYSLCPIAMMLGQLLFSVFITNVVIAMPEGAPNDPVACRDMTPKHQPHSPQNSPSPYILQAENDGNEVLVTILAAVEDTFTGFFLQAREADDSLIGTFVTMEPLAKTINCLGGVNNAVTHNTKDSKTIITSYWTPPGGVPQNVTFKLTMVRNYEEFWVGQTLFFDPSVPSTSTVSEWSPTSTTGEWDTTPNAPDSAKLSSHSNINVVVLVLIGYMLLS